MHCIALARNVQQYITPGYPHNSRDPAVTVSHYCFPSSPGGAALHIRLPPGHGEDLVHSGEVPGAGGGGGDAGRGAHGGQDGGPNLLHSG